VNLWLQRQGGEKKGKKEIEDREKKKRWKLQTRRGGKAKVLGKEVLLSNQH